MTQANNAQQIFLVGFMGCGKSTVGPLLAAQLGRPFIDLDLLIEEEMGYTIFEYVLRQGEEPFRGMEAGTLLDVAQGKPAVIAPGGGAITQAPNREVMRQYGVTVWLDTPFEICWQRIAKDGATRPLAPDEATARARYETRLPLYQASDVRIEMGNNVSAEDLAKQARLALAQRG